MNPEIIIEMLTELRALPYFPNDEVIITVLLRLVGLMCESEAQVRWLVDRMTSGIYAQWPGPQEMRACFCCRYKPKDGLSAYSQVYPDGLPPDPTAPPRISAPDFKRLPPGQQHSADAKCEQMAETLAEKQSPSAPTKKLTYSDRRRASAFKSALEATITAPCDRPNPKPPEAPTRQYFTQSDIDAAVAELHASKREEVAK